MLIGRKSNTQFRENIIIYILKKTKMLNNVLLERRFIIAPVLSWLIVIEVAGKRVTLNNQILLACFQHIMFRCLFWNPYSLKWLNETRDMGSPRYRIPVIELVYPFRSKWRYRFRWMRAIVNYDWHVCISGLIVNLHLFGIWVDEDICEL